MLQRMPFLCNVNVTSCLHLLQLTIDEFNVTNVCLEAVRLARFVTKQLTLMVANTGMFYYMHLSTTLIENANVEGGLHV